MIKVISDVIEYVLPMNLQTFASDETEIDLEQYSEYFEGEEQQDDEEQEEIEESEDDEEEEFEESDDEEQEDDDQDDEEESVSHGNETAKSVIAERNKWKARMAKLEAKSKELKLAAGIAQRFMSQTGVTDFEEMNRRMDEVESQRLQQSGVPPEMADRIAKAERQIKEQERDIRRQKHSLEFESLKIDPFYSDIEEYREELEEFAERAGTSIKEAYLSKHGERRMKERELEIEAKVKANKKKRAAKKVDTTATGTSSTKSSRKVNLSDTERSIAKMSGMTPEEYAKYKR